MLPLVPIQLRLLRPLLRPLRLSPRLCRLSLMALQRGVVTGQGGTVGEVGVVTVERVAPALGNPVRVFQSRSHPLA